MRHGGLGDHVLCSKTLLIYNLFSIIYMSEYSGEFFLSTPKSSKRPNLWPLYAHKCVLSDILPFIANCVKKRPYVKTNSFFKCTFQIGDIP